MIPAYESPWQMHMRRGHVGSEHVSHVSFNAIDVFEECAACRLCWLLPNVVNRNQYPITIWRYPMERTTESHATRDTGGEK